MLIILILSVALNRWGKGWPKSVSLVVGTAAALGAMVAYLATYPAMSTALRGNPGALAIPVGMMLAMAGFQLVARGLKGRRRGDSLHCPKCDYERGENEADAPIRCPECGHPWLGNWVKGRLVRSPAMAWTGAALLLPPLLMLASSFTSIGGSLVRSLPTGAIITLASLDAWGHNTTAWAEIGKRPLSATQEADLAARLLNARFDSGYLYGPGSTWLESAVLTGGVSGPLPQPLRDRYFAEIFEPRIDVPDRVAKGDAVPIWIMGPYRGGGAPSWTYISIDEVRVDGAALDPALWHASESNGWVCALYLANDRDLNMKSFRGNGLVEPPPLDTNTIGPRHIIVHLTKCLVSTGTSPGPGITPLFTTTMTIERTVTVDVR